jgi:CDP-glycerol glycerophosphotransferase (TagB/SpsB family)
MNLGTLCCFDESPQLIDHLSYISHLLGAPMLVSHHSVYETIKKFYPFVDVNLELDWKKLSLESLAQRFDVCIYSGFYSLVNELSPFRAAKAPPLRSIFCPHGNSDKGFQSKIMEWFSKEDICLVYGNRMKDFLKAKGVQDSRNWVTTGNYRFLYYKKYKNHFDKLAHEYIFSKFDAQLPFVLYAPTWKDLEDASSFPAICPYLLKGVGKSWNLIVKLHPLLKSNLLAECVYWEGLFAQNSQTLFLDDFPMIYPLLSKIDLYIGDLSSIGYDFLVYNKPMILLNPHNRKWKGLGTLFELGIELKGCDFPKLLDFIELALSQQVDKECYNIFYTNTFCQKSSLESIRESIFKKLGLFKGDSK